MSVLKSKIIEQLNNILGWDLNEESLTIPPNSKMGDFALPCFGVAKVHEKTPNEMAQKAANKIIAYQDKENKFFEKAETAGPYLNLFLDKQFLNSEVLSADLVSKHKTDTGEKVMIEYSQPNTHKEFHIGHLRNACLGASLVEIIKFSGKNVISSTYVNDVGTHVAKCVWNYMKNHLDEQIPENRSKFFGDIYAEAVRKIEENEDLKKEVAEFEQKLENKDKDVIKVWKKTRDWCVEEFKDVYKLMNIKFDKWYYESDVMDKGKEIVDNLLEKGIAKKSEGAVIVDLKKYDLDVFLILKSDGTRLYSTSDLALAYTKAKEKANISYYVVDNRQSLHFKQLFKTLELDGFKEKMIHIAYDFVTLPEGAFSSRKGNAVTFGEFFETISNKAKEETQKRHGTWSSKQVDEVARKVALSALKFFMLKYDKNSVIEFDFNKAMSMDGDTGTYILYTVARINSILRKEKVKKKVDYATLVEDEEKSLILKLDAFAGVVQRAAKEYSPNCLTTYLIELAQLFNNFYHSHSVLQAEPIIKEARLLLINQVKNVLAKGLDLLNIQYLEEM